MTCGPMCMQLFIEAGEWLVVPGDFELACSECPRNTKPEEQHGQLELLGVGNERN